MRFEVDPEPLTVATLSAVLPAALARLTAQYARDGFGCALVKVCPAPMPQLGHVRALVGHADGGVTVLWEDVQTAHGSRLQLLEWSAGHAARASTLCSLVPDHYWVRLEEPFLAVYGHAVRRSLLFLREERSSPAWRGPRQLPMDMHLLCALSEQRVVLWRNQDHAVVLLDWDQPDEVAVCTSLPFPPLRAFVRDARLLCYTNAHLWGVDLNRQNAWQALPGSLQGSWPCARLRGDLLLLWARTSELALCDGFPANTQLERWRLAWRAERLFVESVQCPQNAPSVELCDADVLPNGDVFVAFHVEWRLLWGPRRPRLAGFAVLDRRRNLLHWRADQSCLACALAPDATVLLLTREALHVLR